MVGTFYALHGLDAELYGSIQDAVAQIKRNTFAAILLQCDPGETLEMQAEEKNDFKDLQEKCGTGLWKAAGLKRKKFPTFKGQSARITDAWWDASLEDPETETNSESEPSDNTVDGASQDSQDLPKTVEAMEITSEPESVPREEGPDVEAVDTVDTAVSPEEGSEDEEATETIPPSLKTNSGDSGFAMHGSHSFGDIWHAVSKPFMPVILKSRGQVAAGLSVTRSFGDVDFKVPAEVVTAVPELSAFAIDPEEDVMLILSSDGVTGSVTDMEAVRLASGPLREGGSDAAEKAARLLVETAHARDPSDDKTALVIWFGEKPDNPVVNASGVADEEDLFTAAAEGPKAADKVEAEVPQTVQEDDMFADGADPMEMALLDDIFGAYARDMGVPCSDHSHAAV
ncbi:unnamed protein product [Cladocopium goreaui]|uniref:PPM-type phosphatase domain-containing protein n=1 Tax=Cladocopium goreaui TaxID=2562237 RepID=A0A9P1DFL7_9DINO|nr:unnamed protein product [Cladocopium goreaui]